MAKQDNWEPSCTLKFKLQENRQKGIGTDVTFYLSKDEEQKFPAHKLILSAASPYFERMFQGSFKEAHSEQVEIKFDRVTMNNVLDFIYVDKDANIQLENMDHIKALLEASNMLELMDLFRLCCRKAESFMKAEDFGNIASLHQLYQNEHSKLLLQQFVAKYWMNILNSDLYLTCSFQQFEMLIDEWNKSPKAPRHLTRTARNPGFMQPVIALQNDSNTACIFAESMVKKIVQWIKENPSERIQSISPLLAKINLQELPRSFVKSLIDEEIVKTNCDVLLQLLISVL